MRESKKLRIAILNMYLEDSEQQGLRCIQEILDKLSFPVEYKFYNVRAHYELPGLEYDVYLSTGGPGNPLEFNVNWSENYFSLVDQIIDWNMINKNKPKFWFAICHSFQMLCSYLQVGTITKREFVSFGIVPLKKTNAGLHDELLSGFNNIFYAADHRYFQVITPDLARIDAMGATILALDEFNASQPLERSLMAVRFSPEMVGVQFHPEADVKGMKIILENERMQADIKKLYGSDKLNEIMQLLDDPDTIDKMYETLLPEFLKSCQNRYSQILRNNSVPENV